MQITKHSVASLEYTLTNDQGEVLDTTSGRGPLAYIHGTESIIPGLEQELDGKQPGDAFQVRIDPASAYGERDENMVQSVARTQMPDGELEVGMQLQAQSDDGNAFLVTVTEVADDQVTLDANHPLAGVALNFDVKVVDVRTATEDELAHGHPHGPGGHDH
jgi:FKBP-type peptidyl-prolyl cis-trans isomerase SlyD